MRAPHNRRRGALFLLVLAACLLGWLRAAVPGECSATWRAYDIRIADYWSAERGRFILYRSADDQRLRLFDLLAGRGGPLGALPAALPVWPGEGEYAAFAEGDQIRVIRLESGAVVRTVSLPGLVWRYELIASPDTSFVAALVVRERERVPSLLVVVDVRTRTYAELPLGGAPLQPRWSAGGRVCYGWQAGERAWEVREWIAPRAVEGARDRIAPPSDVATLGLTAAMSAAPNAGFLVFHREAADPTYQAAAYWAESRWRAVADRVRTAEWSPAALRLGLCREPEYEFTLVDGVPAYSRKEANGLFLFDPRDGPLALLVEALAPSLSYQRPPATPPPTLRFSKDGRFLWLCHGSVWPTGLAGDEEGPSVSVVEVDVGEQRPEQRLGARGWADGVWLSPGEAWLAVKLFLTQKGAPLIERVFFVPTGRSLAPGENLDTASLPGSHQRFVTWLNEETAVIAYGDEATNLSLTRFDLPRRQAPSPSP